MDRGRRIPVRGTYIGVEAIMENVFSQLGSEWDDYKASVNTYHEVSEKDVIIAEGMYSGVYKETENHLKQNLFIYGNLKMEKS